MKKLLIMTVLAALALTASFVSADPRDAIRNPPSDLRGMWRCQQEDQAKLDKTFKAFEDECTKLLETRVERRR